MRWDNLLVEAREDRTLPGYKDPAVVRRFDAPEALDTRFYEVHCRSAINQVPKQSRMPFRHTINPYRGCSHACNYCFARPTHTFLGFDAGRDFEREIVVKVNLPEVLRAELARPSWKREHVALGTNTDPYQWVEGRYRLMPDIWRALLESRTPCSLLTKSPLMLRDLDVLAELAREVGFTANVSVPTLDEKAWRATEPHTPHPRKRLEAIAELARAGIPTGVLIAPLMPGINDSPAQVDEILALATEAGAGSVSGITLHLRGEVRDVFMGWLREHRPDLVERYERLYARGAYAPTDQRETHRRLVAAGRRRTGAPPASDGGQYRTLRRDPAPERNGASMPGARAMPAPRKTIVQETLF